MIVLEIFKFIDVLILIICCKLLIVICVFLCISLIICLNNIKLVVFCVISGYFLKWGIIIFFKFLRLFIEYFIVLVVLFKWIVFILLKNFCIWYNIKLFCWFKLIEKEDFIW